MESRAVYVDYRLHGVVIVAFDGVLLLVAYAANFAWRDTILVLDALGGNFVVIAGGTVAATWNVWLAIESAWAAWRNPGERPALAALTVVNVGGIALTALLLTALARPALLAHATLILLGALWLLYGIAFAAVCWFFSPPLNWRD